MSPSKTAVSSDRQAVSPNRRRFPEDFKREASRLIVEEEYTFKPAAAAGGDVTR
jgi:hypothetical protein